jgi:hypothetical protein
MGSPSPCDPEDVFPGFSNLRYHLLEFAVDSGLYKYSTCARVQNEQWVALEGRSTTLSATTWRSTRLASDVDV